MPEKVLELVDYGGGNLGSIRRCLDRLDLSYRITDGNSPPTGQNPIVFPGVGAFGAAMKHINASGLDKAIQTAVRGGTPYLGICIGLQVLFDTSEESPGTAGLGLVSGNVTRFRQGKVPQIGWNKITPASGRTSPEGYVYFVNTYYPTPKNTQSILYEADYHGPFCAAVQQDNITAFQFHPEKSGTFGHSLIRRWANAV